MVCCLYAREARAADITCLWTCKVGGGIDKYKMREGGKGGVTGWGEVCFQRRRDRKRDDLVGTDSKKHDKILSSVTGVS